MKLLPYPSAAASVRADHLQGPGPDAAVGREDAPRARRRHLDHLPGADDLAQSAAHDREADQRDPGAAPRHHRPGGPRAGDRAADPGRHSGAGDAARQLSAPALGRPAPARHDRDRARQRARPADRRRADHRARRHRAGADPQAAQGPAEPARHGDAVHHPRPRHRAQGRRPRLRDDPGQDRRAGAGRAGLHATRSMPIRGSCSPPSRRRSRRRSIRPARSWCGPTT